MKLFVRTLIVATLAAACGGGAPAPVTTPAPVAAPRAPVGSTAATPRPLPEIPLVDGPLAIRVQYPDANQQITSRDSNFIFGSVGSGRATLSINGAPARVYPNGAFMAYVANPPAGAASYELVATRGSDSVRSTLAIRLATSNTTRPPAQPIRKPESAPTSRADSMAALSMRIDSLRMLLNRSEPIGYAQLGVSNAARDTDVTIIGKPIPGGTYKWFFTPGTVVPVISRANGSVRIRLDSQLDVYVDSAEVHDLPSGTMAPRRTMSNMRVRASSTGADVIMPMGSRTPYFVEELDRALRITFYGVNGNTDIVNYASADSLVRTVEWEQIASDRAQVTVNLRHAPYGYLVLFENNAMVLKVRGRPAIDVNRPLAGLVIAVDPGHPPAGATGPTGLYEGNATLPIGMQLKRILEERGARVFMTRTTEAAVALDARPVMSRKENVNAFISIHLNALPDGINPFSANGTGTYFFRTQSEPLARFVQAGMIPQLGLRDLGVNYDNLAVVRGTWYPAILCEGAFVIMPDQEAALRTPEYQERYAHGVADGMENYFRALASAP